MEAHHDSYWEHLGTSLENQDKFAEDEFDNQGDFWNFEKNTPKVIPPHFSQPQLSSQNMQRDRRQNVRSPVNRGFFKASARQRNNFTSRTGQKRKANDAQLSEREDSRASKVLRAFTPEKTCVSILNEAKISSESYVFGDQTGPSHLPVFSCSVTVDGSVFSGFGNSKKIAKESAARKAVEFLMENVSKDGPVGTTEAKEPDVIVPSEVSPEEHISVSDQSMPPENRPLQEPGTCKTSSLDQSYSDLVGARVLENAFRDPACPTNPSSVQKLAQLMSNFPPVKVELLRKLLNSAHGMTGPENSVQFALRFFDIFQTLSDFGEMSSAELANFPAPHKKIRQFGWKLTFFEEQFFGLCQSKLGAKRIVADQFLNWLLDVIPVAWRIITVPAELNRPLSGQNPEEDTSSRRFAALVCLKSYEKLDEFYLKFAGSQYSRYLNQEHVAAVFLFQNGQLKPVSLACGSSIIYRKNLSSKGRNIKDCQAEILALRAAKLFVLNQIKSFYQDEDSIFAENAENSCLELKPDIGFHLYISHVPSGSCSVSSSSPEQATKLHLHSVVGQFVNQNLNALSPNEPVQNSYWDILEGQQKLHIMSSSDKLMKKAITGIQGALASCFVQPTFLQTITVRGKVDLVAVASGLYHRILPSIVSQKDLPPDCGIVCPEVCRTDHLKETDLLTIKEKDSMKAFVWCADGKSGSLLEEFLQSSTGLTATNQSSALSKRNMATLFRSIVSFMKQKEKITANLKDVDLEQNTKYVSFKNASLAYKNRREFFCELLKTAGIGQWIAKCQEEDCFTLDNQAIQDQDDGIRASTSVSVLV